MIANIHFLIMPTHEKDTEITIDIHFLIFHVQYRWQQQLKHSEVQFQ